MSDKSIDLLFQELWQISPKIRKNYKSPMIGGQSLPVNHMICFFCIFENKVLSMSELSKKTIISSQQLTRIVTSLEDLHWVVRTLNPNNRRSVNVSITEEGNRILKAEFKKRIETFKTAVKNLSPEEVEECAYHLREANRILSKVTFKLDEV